MADNPNQTVPLAGAPITPPPDTQPVLPPPLPPLPPLPSPPEPIPTPQAPPPPSSNKHGASFNKKKFPVLPLLMVFLLIGGLFGAIVLTQQKQETRSKASSSDVTLQLSGRKEATAGAELRVSVTMSTNDLKITAAHIVMKFDPEYLEFIHAKPGDALPTLVARKNASDTAELIVALECDTSCTPYKGSGQIGLFRFRTVKDTLPSKPVKIVLGPRTTITTLGTKANVKGILANAEYALTIKTQSPLTTPTPVACTLEARICPDGSSVDRVPPSCVFAPCPSATCYPRPSCLDDNPPCQVQPLPPGTRYCRQ